jgi:hypothetical protein
MRHQPLFSTILFCLLYLPAYCQPRPAFKGLRFEEDYSFLKNDSGETNFYRKIKFVPLTRDKSVYFSVGGEIRQEFDAFRNEDWGIRNLRSNNFYLQRYNLHADVHTGKRFRVFAQLRSAPETGRKDGPRPIDEDDLNIQNLFAEYQFIIKSDELLYVRAGRQEMFFGSQRLISLRDGPNLRYAFDAARMHYQKKNVALDALLAGDIHVNPGVFDNERSKKINLWGLYSTVTFRNHPRYNMDIYYLGIHHMQARYEEGTAGETRHSAGLRFWNSPTPFTFDLEMVLQWGKFSTGRILAWTASSSIGYLFNHLTKCPTFFGLKTDVISGDGQFGDHKLGTFNALFPKTGYFGFDPQVGPANMIDFHPYIIQHFGEKFRFQADAVLYWRYSLHDGLYHPNGAFNLAGSSSTHRHTGTNYLGQLTYEFNQNLAADFGIQYFIAGNYLHDIGGTRNALLTNTRVMFKF